MTLRKKIEMTSINEENEYLVEGIRFFKTSKKITSYIKKIEKKNTNGSLDGLIERLERVSKNFEVAERMHQTGRKTEAKQLYLQYKKDNILLMTALNKESTKKILVRLGIGLIVLQVLLSMTTGIGLYERLFMRGASTAARMAGRSGALVSTEVLSDNLPGSSGAPSLESLDASQLVLNNEIKNLKKDVGFSKDAIKDKAKELAALEKFEKALKKFNKANGKGLSILDKILGRK